MKTELIKTLTDSLDSIARKTEDGVEFWLARDLQKLLGYEQWRNYKMVISKAQKACELSGQKVSNHFADVTKTVSIGSESQRGIEDMMLTRYACYLIAQNGDPRKEEVAFAQHYFASQTRKYEVIEKKIRETERIVARRKLAHTEKELSHVVMERTQNEKSLSIIRSKGDKALFGYTTAEMKDKWSVPGKRPIADFAPTIILKAKDFAAEITIFNTKKQDMQSEDEISQAHSHSNQSVRKTLIEHGIDPAQIAPAEDIKKVERAIKAEERKSLKSAESLPEDPYGG